MGCCPLPSQGHLYLANKTGVNMPRRAITKPNKADVRSKKTKVKEQLLSSTQPIEVKESNKSIFMTNADKDIQFIADARHDAWAQGGLHNDFYTHEMERPKYATFAEYKEALNKPNVLGDIKPLSLTEKHDFSVVWFQPHKNDRDPLDGESWYTNPDYLSRYVSREIQEQLEPLIQLLDNQLFHPYHIRAMRRFGLDEKTIAVILTAQLRFQVALYSQLISCVVDIHRYSPKILSKEFQVLGIEAHAKFDSLVKETAKRHGEPIPYVVNRGLDEELSDLRPSFVPIPPWAERQYAMASQRCNVKMGISAPVWNSFGADLGDMLTRDIELIWKPNGAIIVCCRDFSYAGHVYTWTQIDHDLDIERGHKVLCMMGIRSSIWLGSETFCSGEKTRIALFLLEGVRRRAIQDGFNYIRVMSPLPVMVHVLDQVGFKYDGMGGSNWGRKVDTKTPFMPLAHTDYVQWEPLEPTRPHLLKIGK